MQNNPPAANGINRLIRTRLAVLSHIAWPLRFALRTVKNTPAASDAINMSAPLVKQKSKSLV